MLEGGERGLGSVVLPVEEDYGECVRKYGGMVMMERSRERDDGKCKYEMV